MKTLSSLLLIAFLLSGCANQREKDLQFHPNQETTVRYELSNITGSTPFMRFYNQTLPFRQFTERWNFASDTTFTETYSIKHPVRIVLQTKKNSILFFGLPGDTLHVKAKLDEKAFQNVNYEGKTASASDYLTNERKHFKGCPTKGENPKPFYHSVDSFYQKELAKVDSLSSENLLPEWFAPLQKENLKNEREYVKMLYYDQQRWFHDNFIPQKKRMMPSVDLMNIEHPWQTQVNYLLGGFKEAKYDTLLTPEKMNKDISIKYTQHNIDQLKEKLPENVLSYHVASRISGFFTEGKAYRIKDSEFPKFKEQINELIETNKHLIKNPVHLSELKKEKEKYFKKVENRITLSEGDDAPPFFLKNRKGETVKLSDFKGKTILVNFWGTYCLGCIKSIPDKNKMCREFYTEDFALVNICLDPSYDEWKNIIDENNFSGTHLICNDKQNDYLTSEYNINTVAHYTVIDQNGKVIKNGVRDSVRHYIENSL
ncbi:MAG: TlpA family protein disulfide reductase [Bacteroidota bacterium]